MTDETSGVAATACSECGAVSFPARYLCRRCNGSKFVEQRLGTGFVEETTVVRRAFGQRDPEPRHLATVRTAEGPVFIVGLDGPVDLGVSLDLYQVGDAPHGRPHETRL